MVSAVLLLQVNWILAERFYISLTAHSLGQRWLTFFWQTSQSFLEEL